MSFIALFEALTIARRMDIVAPEFSELRWASSDSASYKPQFEDYTLDFVQDNDDAWRAAGYPMAEAKLIAATSLELPYLAPMKQLAQETVALANSYRQAGDEASAQLALQLGANVGQRFGGTPGEPLVSQLVGIAVESIALRSNG
jgi:hypothetical protein